MKEKIKSYLASQYDAYVKDLETLTNYRFRQRRP